MCQLTCVEISLLRLSRRSYAWIRLPSAKRLRTTYLDAIDLIKRPAEVRHCGINEIRVVADEWRRWRIASKSL